MNNAEYKVVGSSCLVDFIGSTSAQDVASLFEMLSDALEAASGSEGSSTNFFLV